MAEDGADAIRAERTGRIDRRRERPNALTAKRRQQFLDMLAATANVRRTAAAADAFPACFYRLRRRDAPFAAAWQQALADAVVRLEGEMLARALGEADTEVGDGDRAGEAGRVDTRLGMDLLKRNDRREARGLGKGAVESRQCLPIEEVERVLLARLDALARQAGRA